MALGGGKETQERGKITQDAYLSLRVTGQAPLGLKFAPTAPSAGHCVRSLRGSPFRDP